MKKQFITTAMVVFLTFLFFKGLSQEKNYGILIFDKADIQKYYDSGVSFFAFRYKHPLFASRKLKCTPFNAAGNPMKPFKPKKVARHDKQSLQNNYFRGVLVLSIDEMKENGITGDFDIYLIPKQCDECSNKNFVSYLIDSSLYTVKSGTMRPVANSMYSPRGSYTGPGNSSGILTNYAPPPFKSFAMNHHHLTQEAAAIDESTV